MDEPDRELELRFDPELGVMLLLVHGADGSRPALPLRYSSDTLAFTAGLGTGNGDALEVIREGESTLAGNARVRLRYSGYELVRTDE